MFCRDQRCFSLPASEASGGFSNWPQDFAKGCPCSPKWPFSLKFFENQNYMVFSKNRHFGALLVILLRVLNFGHQKSTFSKNQKHRVCTVTNFVFRPWKLSKTPCLYSHEFPSSEVGFCIFTLKFLRVFEFWRKTEKHDFRFFIKFQKHEEISSCFWHLTKT